MAAETLPSGVGRLSFCRRSRDVSELIGISLPKIRKPGHLGRHLGRPSGPIRAVELYIQGQ